MIKELILISEDFFYLLETMECRGYKLFIFSKEPFLFPQKDLGIDLALIKADIKKEVLHLNDLKKRLKLRQPWR